MSAQITYNGVDPFGVYVPQIERTEVIVDNNGYISHTDKFILSGFLVRDICSTTWAQYHEAMLLFMEVFSENFHELVINDNGQVFSYPNAIVRNISFADNSFYNLVPYTIEIDCIHSYKNLNILEPVDEWSTDQGENSIVTITHRMSCRGVGPNALEDAKSFIENTRNDSVMFSIQTPISSLPILSRTESQNRLTGEYSLTETFLYNEDDPGQTVPGIITYSSDINESQGVTEITISGEIRENAIDQGDVLSLARAKFDSIDWDAIATGLYGISIDKSSVSVQENRQTGVVSFSLGYSSLASNSPYLIDETTITRDFTTGQDCISLRLTVRVDYGCVGSRFEAAKIYAQSLNFNSIVNQKWIKFGPGGTLSSTPQSKSWGEDPIAGVVTLGVTHCTKNGKECGCLENFDYSLDFNPGANQYVAYPIYRALGYYDVQNLNYLTRTRYGINGSARVAKCCSNEQAKLELVGRINALSNFYFTGTDKILEEANITETSNGESLNFSFRWSVA